ncbi:MAG: hypothetical protein R2838_05165 [Caldilineaceae bacterium]
MMEVTVRLFATLRQQAGWSTKQITVADGDRRRRAPATRGAAARRQH